jgi:hypothetical protein
LLVYYCQRSISRRVRLNKNDLKTKINLMKRSKFISSTIIMLLFLAAPALDSNAGITNTDALGGAYALFAEKFGGELTLKEIRATKELGIAGCAAGSTFTKFTLVLYKKGKASRFNATDGTLTKAMIKGLSNLNKGDTFELVNMRAKLPEGRKIDVMSKVYTVV